LRCRRRLVLLSALFLILALLDPSFSGTLFCSENQDPAIKIEKGVMAAMRDGVRLSTNIFRPDTPEKVPVILIRTPYNKERYSERADFPSLAARRGYAVVIQDVRGMYGSEGEFIPYFNDINDGYDSVEWAASLPYSNGKVGTQGCSYLGAVQWQLAVTHPPHLVAIFPQCTFVDGRSFFYFGGTFDLTWIPWLNGQLPDIKVHQGMKTEEASTAEARREWQIHKWEWLNFVPIKDFPIFKGFCPYYYEWIAHSDDGPYWDFADVGKHHKEVTVPAYNFTGWFDDGYGQPGAIRNFQGMRKDGKTKEAREGQRLIIGPWTHCSPTSKAGDLDFGPEAAVDINELVLRWCDFWLKGIDNGIGGEPPIKIFVMGENRWRYENEWPPARTELTSLFMRSQGSANSFYGDGKLSGQAIGEEKLDHYTYDPSNPVTDYFFENTGPRDQRPLEARHDVLVYTSDPLPSDMEVTGEIQAKIWAASTAQDTDFVVKVTDVYPNGYSQSITTPLSGILRAKYRKSESKPELLTPGEIYELTIGSLYTSHVFKSGHCVRAWITSSYFPHIDRNPNTGHPFGEDGVKDFVKAVQTIYHDAQHPSRIILPKIPR